MRARELGIFTNDRGLLSCPECGLAEDLLADGRLLTRWPDSLGRDTGLRFIEPPLGPGRFTCPRCGSAAVEDDAGA